MGGVLLLCQCISLKKKCLELKGVASGSSFHHLRRAVLYWDILLSCPPVF